MGINTKDKQKLKRFIRSLEKIRGRHTELVSVYVPAGYDIIKIIQHLMQEQGTASNIKDKTTQQHVIDSLERMIRHLRLYKKTPENGLAVFSGDISDKEGKSDIQVFAIEPPQPLKIRLYRCDQTFILDVLKDISEVKDMYGLIVLDKREANIGFLKGTQIQEVTEMTSAVPGKTRAGGQCLHPETAVELADGQWAPIGEVFVGEELMSYDFTKKELITTKVLDKWEVMKNKIYKISAGEEIIASGDHLFFLEDGSQKPAEQLEPGMLLLTEDGKGELIKTIITEEKEIKLIDIKVENENFIAEGLVVHNSAQRFARIREEATKEFFNRIGDAANHAFLEVKDLRGILVGGPGMTKNHFLDEGFLNEQLRRKVVAVQDLAYTGSFGLREVVEKSSDVLIKEAITEEKEIMNKFLKLLSTEPNKVAYGLTEVQKALDLSAVEKLLVSESLADDVSEKLEEKCEEIGAEFIIISIDTPEGEQLKEIGKVAAILRYSLS
ncbi:hypothetical protein J4467_03255 [Candidatus Woesearchaeota archaeon]|nr:hypothetical protein [Candidatus Woesearchaeota archaeon]